LFAFTQKKFVHWYDLQAELVDHLASRIEEEWAADPSLDFDQALERVYKGFGIFGFAHVVQEKSAQLQKQQNKMWWRELRAFFSWPRISAVALAAALLWQLHQWVPHWWIAVSMFALYAISHFPLLYYKKALPDPEKKLMLLQVRPETFSGSLLIPQIFTWTLVDAHAIPFTCISFVSILCNLATQRVYRRVWTEAKQGYPQAFAPAS